MSLINYKACFILSVCVSIIRAYWFGKHIFVEPCFSIQEQSYVAVSLAPFGVSSPLTLEYSQHTPSHCSSIQGQS